MAGVEGCSEKGIVLVRNEISADIYMPVSGILKITYLLQKFFGKVYQLRQVLEKVLKKAILIE